VVDELTCSGCGRAGTAADTASGWSLTTQPRPVGVTRPRTCDERRITALCPSCARQALLDLEARLDP